MQSALSDILSAPFAILPERLAFITAVLRSAGAQDMPTTLQARFNPTASAARRTQAGNGAIAVLPFHGVAVQRTDELGGLLGLLSLDAFARSFRAALADDSIGGILIEMDSPGGSVYGIGELADEIYRARATKPIVAIANSLAASGAYWISSSASEFFVTPGGEVGSIGVVAMHQDLSQALAKAGVKTTLIAAGKYKLDGHPALTLGADAQRHMQARVDERYSAFVRSVARNRGVDPATVRNGFGQGRLLGAERAKRENMVNDVATFDEVVRRLAQRINQGKAGRPGFARRPISGTATLH